MPGSTSLRNLRSLGMMLAGAATIAACAPAPDERTAVPADSDTAAVRVAIDTLRARYEAAFAASDFDALGALLTDDAVAVQPGGAAWDSLRTASSAPWPPGSTITITPRETRVLSPDWAYEFGTSVVTYTPVGAQAPRQLNGTYLVILRRTDDGWKVHRDVGSSNLPPE